jgi:uncharacterized protein
MKGRITFWFIGVCVAIFIAQNLVNLSQFAFTPATAFQKPWTFVTSIFMHADINHIFFNMFALFIFGIYLEGMVSEKKYLLIFFLSGMAGSVGYMLTAFDSMIPAVGASGAIYGIIGTLAAMRPGAIVYIGFAPMPVAVAAAFYTIVEFLGLFAPSSIAHGAHLFGLFFGIAYGLYLRRQSSRLKFIWES